MIPLNGATFRAAHPSESTFSALDGSGFEVPDIAELASDKDMWGDLFSIPTRRTCLLREVAF